MPSTWKSSSSEIPSTTSGITSGLSRSAVTSPLAAEAAPREPDRREDPERDRDDARDRGDDRARLQRRLHVAVVEEVVVPVEREAAQRERPARARC